MSAKSFEDNRQARQRIAAQRAADQHRRTMLVVASTATAVILLAVAALVGARLLRHSNSGTAAAKAPSSVQAMTGPAPAALTAQLAGVSPAVLDKVGAGQVNTLPVTVTKAPALTSGGKPEILYIGAEYCPYCAAERWPLIIALSRFGAFHGLQLTHSSSSDVDPNTPSFSFHGAGYTSDYLSFTGVETNTDQPAATGNGYGVLDTPTAAEQQVLSTYDAAPYLPADSAGAIPFADLGGRYLISGASYDPQLLAGLTQQQVAATLDNPGSPIAQAVDGTANALTTALCKLTGGKPAAVCTSAAAGAYQGKLG
ncbi:DUF929 domain-containing protein [Streptacidiphilus sp. 4-A2]|nr:DUF929 domain-containing protein [Streptacidiphilus sp. 4-A2]